MLPCAARIGCETSTVAAALGSVRLSSRSYLPSLRWPPQLYTCRLSIGGFGFQVSASERWLEAGFRQTRPSTRFCSF